jgi:SAM-dependent methyltransferase
MSRYTQSLPPDYFDERYAADPDPWRFETSTYEQAKYEATLAALPRARYASGLEIGCSIGVLTARLAERCESLVALDVADAAIERARIRCAGLGHIKFVRAQIPAAWPTGTFDLILLSEVVYYLDAADVRRLVARVRDCMRPNADIVLVHWTGETHYPLTGDQAADIFIEEAAVCGSVATSRTEAYRLDVLRMR